MNKQALFILLLTASLSACTTGKKTSTVSKETNMNNDSNAITGKYWKLIELEGQKVTMSADQEQEAYFMLKPEDSSVVGHGGCNTINGTYKLLEGNRIQFSNMAATLKACDGVKHEAEFFEVLQLADNYTTHNDTLWLNKARRAPLAIFQAVYFK